MSTKIRKCAAVFLYPTIPIRHPYFKLVYRSIVLHSVTLLNTPNNVSFYVAPFRNYAIDSRTATVSSLAYTRKNKGFITIKALSILKL